MARGPNSLSQRDAAVRLTAVEGVDDRGDELFAGLRIAGDGRWDLVGVDPLRRRGDQLGDERPPGRPDEASMLRTGRRRRGPFEGRVGGQLGGGPPHFVLAATPPSESIVGE